MKFATVSALAVALSVGLFAGSAFADGDEKKGAKVFKKCKACHTVEEGGKQGGTIKAVTGFMDVLLGGIIEMIEAIGEVANSVDPSQIGAIKAIASVIEGIGKLIAGVVPPIAELAMGMIESSTEGGGIFSSGKVNTGKFDSMMGSIKGLMSGVFGVMKEQIGPQKAKKSSKKVNK